MGQWSPDDYVGSWPPRTLECEFISVFSLTNSHRPSDGFEGALSFERVLAKFGPTKHTPLYLLILLAE
jgi:hypothetical protein